MEYHRALWIDINENRLLGFQLHEIISPMARRLCPADTRIVNTFNYTLHTSFLKHDIY